MAGFRWYVRFSKLHRCFLSLETALHRLRLLPMQTYIFVPPHLLLNTSPQAVDVTHQTSFMVKFLVISNS